MAQISTITDDLDGSSGASTFYFGFDGGDFEIDLTEENVAKFKAAVAPFLSSARPRKHTFGIA